LLARYTRDRAEDAFAELVRRHVNLVHSAALRQVRSPQLAEEVAQSAFTDLARNAHRLAPDTILTAWLYQVTRRTAIDVVRREARRQLREQIATEMNAMNATTAEWTHIEPLLDDAMSALDDTDRAAVLLRYFENKSLREVGATLGTSDGAAQKRVSRAVERMREFFAKRGVTVGASGLVVVISANAVQAAPVGLAVTISTAAALAGSALVTTTTSTVGILQFMASTKIKLGLAALVTASVITPMIMQRQLVSQLRAENEDFRTQLAASSNAPSAGKTLTDSDTDELARLRAEHRELMRSRGQITSLRRQLAETSINSVAVTNAPPGFYDFNPVEKWTNAGLGTPVSAHQTRLWAESNQDREKFLQSIAAADGPGASPDTMAVVTKMLALKPWAEVATGFRLIAVNPLSEDLVEVQTQTEWKSGKKDVGLEVLKRVGNEWKALVFSFKIDDDHSTWAFVHAGQLNAAGEFVNTISLPDESK
jgi:RNA polymerase sigma factor (sigma-70 family)